MCFSASASLTTSAALFSIGVFTLINAIQINKNTLPLALIPILFSIQQFSEGIVWLTMGSPHTQLLHNSILVYLFFAFLLWPAYFPFCFYYLEPSCKRRRLLLVLTGLGLVCGLMMYIPLLTHQIDLNLALSHQSLVYSMARTAYSQTLYSVSYVLIIFFSALACSRKDIQLFGGLILASFLISTTWFLYAFVSIWCYFAGILSLFIAYLITANKQ